MVKDELLYGNIFWIPGILCFWVVMCLSSCRMSDSDGSLTHSGSKVGVQMHLLGSRYENSSSKDRTVIKTPNRVFSLSPSSVVLVNSFSSDFPGDNDNKAMGSPLASGTMFRVLVYDSNGQYKTYKDYRVGEAVSPMLLDSNVTYSIVAYSYNTASLPAITTVEQSMLNTARISYDDLNRDLMYYRGSITPMVSSDNKLDITLRHKLAYIRPFISDLSNTGISAIRNARFTPHFPTGTLSLSTGNMFAVSGTLPSASINFPLAQFPSSIAIGTPLFIHGGGGSQSVLASFDGDITIGNVTKTISLPNAITITPGYRSTVNMQLASCGAYMSSGNSQWRSFMCYNLGSGIGLDPFVASSGIHGAKYQWGGNTNESGRYYSQLDDQSNSGIISGWIDYLNPSADDSWIENGKGVNDPCPVGYRMPTRAEWVSVINNNTITAVGNNWVSDASNYSSGLLFGSQLYLPAAGSRDSVNGLLRNRGDYGFYWSSTTLGSNASGFQLTISIKRPVSVVSSNRTFGSSIRCISE